MNGWRPYHPEVLQSTTNDERNTMRILLIKPVEDIYNFAQLQVTLWNSLTNNRNCFLTLPRFRRSTFTWTIGGVIVSEGEPENDPNQFLVHLDGPEVERNRWRFKCISVPSSNPEKA